VRQGWLSPGKKRQQKEVDVLLAVDMLTRSFYKNMTKAVLLAGDRDFKPVVEVVELAWTGPGTEGQPFRRTEPD
jgi:uncharacterized LabA/DUF88 family protein